MTLPRDWHALTSEHSAAVAEYAAAVRALEEGRWSVPPAAGKWSPAEVTGHLCEAYQVLRGELAGRPGMRVVVPPLRRWVIRTFLLPRLLATGRFPRAARAPRETRPARIPSDPRTGLAELTAQAEGFERELNARVARGTVRLTHAYFGALDARTALRLTCVHTRHHARQVAAMASASLPPG